MSGIPVEELLREISADAPCGENLEYDPVFGEMERTAQGKPEQQIGDAIIPAEDPDWRAVKRQCLELLKRTKDFRVVVQLAPAVLNTEGWPAFRDCLALMRGYVDQYWETVHPQLDPDDDNDPTMRVNALVSLCDSAGTLRILRKTPLVASRALGRFSLMDVELAKGELPPPAGSEPPQMSAIEAAFKDCDLEALQANAASVHDGVELVEALERSLTTQVGVSRSASFKPLVDLLRRADKLLAEQLVRRGVGTAAADVAGPAGSGGGAAADDGQRLAGKVMSREDVMLALDKICEYYERYEPSSPLPLLLRRAKRLADKSFLEIIRDLTPDALSQAQALGGLSSGEGESSS